MLQVDAGQVGSGGGGDAAPHDAGGETTSPDGSGPHCTGVATPCSLVANCASVMGCTSGGSCSGVSTSCYSEFSSYSCDSQQGCVWDSSSSSCSGFSWSCDSFSGSYTCIDQDGCNWTDGCQGTALPCDTLTVTDCTKQPGCSVSN